MAINTIQIRREQKEAFVYSFKQINRKTGNLIYISVGRYVVISAELLVSGWSVMLTVGWMVAFSLNLAKGSSSFIKQYQLFTHRIYDR